MSRILVVGSGGRESAMVWKLAQNPQDTIYCVPGNAGMEKDSTYMDIGDTSNEQLLLFAESMSVDLTIVGPEAPLVAGIVDTFRSAGQLICGPTAMAAQTEGSKLMFKEFLFRHFLPTASFVWFNYFEKEDALACIESRGVENIVVKADGLMGGKGVFLPSSIKEARQILKQLMVKGSPGDIVVIEERLSGVERSVMAMTDGTEVYFFPFTQDYKRVGDGDTGPNTGGMGAHTLDLPSDEADQLKQLMCKVVDGLMKDRIVYTGFIYLGVMMTSDGPKILECNCRLGDPETQVILPSIDGDFAELCMAVARGNLASVPAPEQIKHALGVVLASADYPNSSSRHDVISGLDVARGCGDLVFDAGTTENNRGEITTGGSGRVLIPVGLGDDVRVARKAAYGAVEKIFFDGMKYRKDIGVGVI